ncbi:MAG: TetR family transcriptional regulator [Ilumatobacter sp.]|nr:TetR family transcriptional regulator [Ilumatobacter sp.]
MGGGPTISTGDRSAGDRRLTEQGRERKQQLVDAAMRLFAERGYAATRISDICAEAGVAKGLFYWYFPTKVDLFDELVRTMRQRLRRAQADAMAAQTSALDKIRVGTEASVVFIAEHAHYFALVEVERADPAVADTLRGTNRVYLDDVIGLIRTAQDDGEVADGDPRLLALGVLGAVSSFGSAFRNGQIGLDADELAAFVGRWVDGALRG